MSLFFSLPWVAQASVEDLYLPQGVLDAIRIPWTVDSTFALVRGNIELERRRSQVLREARKDLPVRKGPCPCGSGKKLKRCCEQQAA